MDGRRVLYAYSCVREFTEVKAYLGMTTALLEQADWKEVKEKIKMGGEAD